MGERSLSILGSMGLDMIMSTIGSFQVFGQAYILTQGGPNNATLFYMLYLYRKAFESFKMGYASALAWILFVIVISLTLLQFKMGGRWVFYGGQR